MLFIGWTTVSSREQAETLAKAMIEANLAACVQIDGPITSFYSLEGRLERAEEFRLSVKLLPARARELEDWLSRHHPYETPEWVVIRAERVAEKYLSWARANCTSAPFNKSHSSI